MDENVELPQNFFKELKPRLEEYAAEENFGSWLEKQMEFPQVSDTFRSLGSPWRVSDGVSQSETINKVLERSFEVQASRIDASSDYHRNASHGNIHGASSHLPKDYVCTSTNNCIEISTQFDKYLTFYIYIKKM